MMKLLVTGGAGFIGSHFVHYMLGAHADTEIVCLDKLTYAGNITSLADLFGDGRFTFVRGDICDEQLAGSLFEDNRFDAVVNFAAESHVDRSISSPRPFTLTNVLGTQTLLDLCVKHGVRFHQVSTDEVYGDLPAGSRERFTEESPLRPSSPYSASKAAADLLVKAYCRTYGLFATISRSGNNYGARQFPEKLIPLAVTLALKRRSVPVYGDGRNERDWIAVEDHCRAVDLILQRGESGEVYNVGADCVCDNLTLVKRILALLGRPESLIGFVPDRRGHDRRYALDCGKLRALGWQPQTEFSEGLRRTVRWYEENTGWVGDILSGVYLLKNSRVRTGERMGGGNGEVH